MRLDDLRRNDVAAAARAYREGLASGRWTPDQGEYILMLQDDSAALEAEIALANRDMPGALERCLAKAQRAVDETS